MPKSIEVANLELLVFCMFFWFFMYKKEKNQQDASTHTKKKKKVADEDLACFLPSWLSICGQDGLFLFNLTAYCRIQQ